MSKLTYKDFKEMEKCHAEGKLFKICDKCGELYKPELRVYSKKNYKKGGENSKRIVGNWFLSKLCSKCAKGVVSEQ